MLKRSTFDICQLIAFGNHLLLESTSKTVARNVTVSFSRFVKLNLWQLYNIIDMHPSKSSCNIYASTRRYVKVKHVRMLLRHFTKTIVRLLHSIFLLWRTYLRFRFWMNANRTVIENANSCCLIIIGVPYAAYTNRCLYLNAWNNRY